MAYPTVDAPYGFRPVNLLGGQVYSGSTRKIPIAKDHATNIFYGDLVSLSANGCINKLTTTDALVAAIGVFMGCSYINSLGQRLYSQYYPATVSQAVDDVNETQAFIADDPDLLMKVAIVAGAASLVISAANRIAMVGGGAIISQGAGSTITGNSKQAILSATAVTTTLPLTVVDVVRETMNASASFTEVIVTWNGGVHMYRTITPV